MFLGVTLLYRLIVIFQHKPEEYDVKIDVYGEDGKLVETREYNSIKQVIFRVREILISRQLSEKPFTIVVEAVKPRIDPRGDNLLYIIDEGLV